MGFMDAMKGANNTWGKATSPDFEFGIFEIGPKNLVDNRQHTIRLSNIKSTYDFDARDVVECRMIAGTSEYVRYFMLLKDGKRIIATIPVWIASEHDGKGMRLAQSTNTKRGLGKVISPGLLNFEWWLAGPISRSIMATQGITDEKKAPAAKPKPKTNGEIDLDEIPEL